MTSGRPTEGVVAQLVDELAPVRPIPSMRSQLVRIAIAWAATAAVAAAWLGFDPSGFIARGGLAFGIALALALIGFAGVTLALAARVPGRERLLAGASVVAAIGIGIGAAACFAAFQRQTGATSFAECLDCTGHSFLLAVPAAIVGLALVLRGAGWRAGVTGLGLSVGAVSMGALLVHSSCASNDPWHWMIGHALLPIALGLVLGVGVAFCLARASRSSGTRGASHEGPA